MRYSSLQVPLTVSPFLSSPRSRITVSPQATKSHSLQAIYFQHNTHSFPQRRQPIPRPFNHFRTLLPLTTSFFFNLLPPRPDVQTFRPFRLSDDPSKPFNCHTSENRARNSSICHTSKIIRLKVLCLPHIRKKGGGPIYC